MGRQSYYLILYDFKDNKRRRLLAKLLKAYGASYQYSVFEARLRPRQLVRLRREIENLVKADEDRVAILEICENCRPKAELLGTQITTICQNVIII
ncbi:MAG: CRISPR-associated endonuclease Cas2 [Planctomycetota bacterium]|nr:CRISPR-associated endonuclease Cas2 [Planctomycetota bacterium]